MNELTHSQRADLYQLVHLPGWEVLKTILFHEEQCLSGEWIETDPANSRAVWAAQAVAHGYHVGCRNVLNRIDLEVENFKRSLNSVPKDAVQEYIDSVVSPFGGLPEQNDGT